MAIGAVILTARTYRRLLDEKVFGPHGFLWVCLGLGLVLLSFLS